MDAQLHGSGVGGTPGTVVPPTCPFFRSVAVDGALRAPLELPDGANRCAAYPPPRPQSALQQELVCLTSDHTDCPRYVQGLQRLREAEARRERLRRVTRPTSMAVAFLLVSAAASFGFVVARGGMTLPAGTVAAVQPSSSVAAVAAAPTGTPEASVAATGAPTVGPTAEPTPAPTPPPPTPTATPPPTPTPTPPPSPTPSPTPEPEIAGLKPCPDQPDCYVYIVVPGDSLWAIGERFGHSLDTVREWNPWTLNRGLRPGAEILLPPPNV